MSDAYKDAIVTAAAKFIRNGTRLTKVGGELVHEVIEHSDKSDPHYALCKAVEAYELAAKSATQGTKEGE